MTKKSSIQNEPTAPNALIALQLASFFISEPVNYIDETKDFLEFLGDCLMETDIFDSKDNRQSFLLLKNIVNEVHSIASKTDLDERQSFAKFAQKLSRQIEESEANNG